MAPLQGPLQEEAADESDTFQVRGSESLAAKRLIDEKFVRGSEMAAVIAYVARRRARRPRTATIQGRGACDLPLGRDPALTLVGTPYGLACGREDPLDLSPGRALLIAPGQQPRAGQRADDRRQHADGRGGGGGDPLDRAAAHRRRSACARTSPARPGFEADRSAAVKGIDETLLLVTCGVLVLLLLAIYRSPLVALVPIFVVGVAYVVAGGMTYALVAAGVTDVSGQTTAILIVLMFGAGTDYCLLIVARFRDELRRTEDVGEAMARATERTGPAILSAGAIVIVAMLVLALADFNATREMGPILALGIAVMVVAGLTLLPAILATLGRRAFWPAVPRGAGRRAPGRQDLAPRRRAGRHAARGDGRRRHRDPARGRARHASAGASRCASPRPSARRPSRCWASSRSPTASSRAAPRR